MLLLFCQSFLVLAGILFFTSGVLIGLMITVRRLRQIIMPMPGMTYLDYNTSIWETQISGIFMLKNKTANPGLLQFIGVMFIWFISTTCAGILAAFFGPGAAALVAGLMLGLCGMSIHLFLWAIERQPHWSYAGLVFGAMTTILLLLVNGSSSWEPIVVFILFISFSLLSYIIYPIANRLLYATNT